MEKRFEALRIEAGKLSDSQITWISGTVAGLGATFAKQPIQRIKWIRQTSDLSTQSYADIVRETSRKYGWRGFFAGSSVAVLRNVPHSALVYSIYPHCALASSKLVGQGETESFLSRFLAGYVTMVVATLVTHPLDTLRVRVSVNPDTVSRTARNILRTEGVGGFYLGFSATIVGAGPRGAVGFAIFETAKPIARENAYLKDRPSLSKIVCGYVAGLLAETVVYPLDTVRRKQQALGCSHPIGRMGTWAAIMSIVSQSGVRGLFKGISLNLIKNPAGTAISFLINDLVKERLGYGTDGDASLSRE